MQYCGIIIMVRGGAGGEEWKNTKQIASIKKLLRWMSQICFVMFGLFIAIGFACDTVCRLILHPRLCPFFTLCLDKNALSSFFLI